MKDWLEKLKKPGRDQILILLLAGILLLVIALPAEENSESGEASGLAQTERSSEASSGRKNGRFLRTGLRNCSAMCRASEKHRS